MFLEQDKKNTITTDNVIPYLVGNSQRKSVPYDFHNGQEEASVAANQHSALLPLQSAKWYGMPLDAWVRYIVSLHFDPYNGSPYWLQKEKEAGIDARKDILSFEDLRLIGPMEENDLRRFPLEYFIPHLYLKNKAQFILGETAGTTGQPKVTAYLKEEFAVIFVDWFRYIAEKRGFPKKANWLWAGPGGPHIIGKAVGPVANSMGSMDPFSIDP